MSTELSIGIKLSNKPAVQVLDHAAECDALDLALAAECGNEEDVATIVEKCHGELDSEAFTDALVAATYNVENGKQILQYMVRNITEYFCGKNVVGAYIEQGIVDKITPSLIQNECSDWNWKALLPSVVAGIAASSIVCVAGYYIVKEASKICSNSYNHDTTLQSSESPGFEYSSALFDTDRSRSTVEGGSSPLSNDGGLIGKLTVVQDELSV